MLYPTPLAQEEALTALAEIRAAAERSTRYSRFSALAGFLSGAAALAGSGVCGWFDDFIGAQPKLGLQFVGLWGAVLLFAATAQIWMTVLKARQRGEAIFTPIARTATASLLGPGIAGVAGSGIFIATEQWTLLPGLWLLLYGCGLWSVSFFAPMFLRVLGAGFIVLGLVAWWQPQLAALWLGLGFGGLHFVFSAVVLARYRS
ncbi:MAG TPA: hypothetical protein VEJ63_04230 [Planctomycetota bacterium]|nr:hypothetical protein [Planctomycetota bacterium]